MEDHPEVSVRIAETQEDMAKSMAIRKIVFVEEQGHEDSIETNSDDALCSHFLLVLIETGEAIGTVRIHNDAHKFGRFAILKPYRGKGYATVLARGPAEHVRKLGGTEIYCHAQVTALNFYKRAGWIEVGPRHMESGVLHQKMIQHL